jgi:hypothetical protein
MARIVTEACEILGIRIKVRNSRIHRSARSLHQRGYLTPRFARSFEHECRPSQARDDRSALLLWQRSAALAGMKENGAPPLILRIKGHPVRLRREKGVMGSW